MFEYLRMEKRVRDKLATAMRYPTMVIGAIAAALALITMYVLPKFQPIFDSLDSPTIGIRVAHDGDPSQTGWLITYPLRVTTLQGVELGVKRKPSPGR